MKTEIEIGLIEDSSDASTSQGLPATTRVKEKLLPMEQICA